MKIKLLFLALFAVAGLPFPTAHAATESSKSEWQIRSVSFSPVACKRSDCWAQGQNGEEHGTAKSSEIQHGNIALIYADGRRAQVTRTGTAVGNRGISDGATADAQLSPDKKTVGWTQGHHQKCTDWSVGGMMFVNSQLVLFRNGRVFRVLEVPGTFIENWRFWNNGKYVAIGSRWHHGLGYVRLFDVNSGKLLERLSTPEAAKKKLQWAKDLTS